MQHEYTEEIFQKASLLQLTTSGWSGSKSVDPGLLAKQSDWVKGRKFLINPELLGQIKTASHQARNKIKKYALPFPLQSVQLVPKEYISSVEEILQHQHQKFWEKVYEFENVYAEAREEAKQVLGELFNPNDYPLEIRRKFNFSWQFLALQVPAQTAILSPEIYEREKQKFEGLMHETREMCMQALRTEFSDLLQELVDKLGANGDKPKKIVANSMFNRLHEFFSEIQTKNIFQDTELMELTESAKNIISQTSPHNLKYNENVREKIKAEMQDLQSMVEQSIIDLPRRQIRMDEEAA